MSETDLTSVPRINGTPITLRARTDVVVRWTRRAVGRAPAPRVRGYAGEVSLSPTRTVVSFS
ncbi:hypothetical protein PVAP13_5NG264424 [Panicum virgatum]|uniref:Uncharacterized protein n=1 Tax=Panicum virgatum TaxID=38727 RepID=A0A8T0S6W6_PANVG|nr:hypothetical protein PVAP13_5NG264424 [Panicum virgatum]